MPEITAFKGITFSKEKIGDFQSVLCPPYDVIPPEMQEALYNASPYNSVRLELPKEDNKYDAAAERLQEWLREGIFERASEETIYPYHQRFTTKDGKPLIRKGFIARCRLYPFSEGVVLPHEKTLSGPKKDRLQLFQKTNANISPIFGLYSDKEKHTDTLLDHAILGHAPFLEAMDYQGAQNRVWKVTDPKVISALRQTLFQKQLYIADGHHRYETAIRYQELMKDANPNHTGEEAYNYIMMFMTNIYDKGLVIFPTHRLIHSLPSFSLSALKQRLSEHFTLTSLANKDAAKAFLATHPKNAFVFCHTDDLFGAALSSPLDHAIPASIPMPLKSLDVTLLHEVVIGTILGISIEAQASQTNLNYSKDFNEVFEKVATSAVQLGIIMNPTLMSEVEAVSQIGEVMPQKSTFFFPKVLTGVVLHDLSM